jgi:hypothetical protein
MTSKDKRIILFTCVFKSGCREMRPKYCQFLASKIDCNLAEKNFPPEMSGVSHFHYIYLATLGEGTGENYLLHNAYFHD